tara:strand:- start:172 stop:489 length:318 start_codon:yes stop_codon:yes gene_type:complete
MVLTKGYQAYKQHWEDQAGFMDKPPWDKDKILKLIISTDFDKNLKELQFSNHSLKKENGKLTLRIKIPNNYYELDDFESQSLDLLGLQEHWLTDIALENSHCSSR